MKIEHVQNQLNAMGVSVTRRHLAKMAMAGGAALSLGSLAPALSVAAAQDETPVEGGVWRMALTANPTAYPITAPGALVDILVNKTIYNSLVQYKLTDGNIEVVPDLAVSWEANEDITQYTFKLRTDVTWHDGEPLTSADVKFTFDSVLDPNVNAQFSGPISAVESVEAPDDETIVFNLKAPFAPLPVMLGYNQAIVPKHLLEGQDLNQPAEFLAAPVGTGPFKFVELSQGSHLQVEANENYFDGRPHLDGIIFQVITDGNARVAQLRSGDIDFTVIDAPQVNSVSDVEALQVVEATQVSYHFLAFNHTVERLQDPSVRRALTLALDRQAIVEKMLQGYGQVANGPTHPALGDFYNPDVTTYGYDPEQSKQLLADAGWTAGDDGILVNENGDRFTILLNGPNGYPVLEQLLTYAQQAFTDLGIEVTLEIDEWSVHLDKYHTLGYDMLCNWWITPPDPDLYDHYFSESSSNWWAYANPEVDELILAGRQEADHDKRVSIYHELQALLADELPVLYLYHQTEIQVRSARTHGMPEMGYRDALSWSEEMWVSE